MFFRSRTWLFAVMVLLVAEDFQYVLKTGSAPVWEHQGSAQKNMCDACDEEDSESENEKQEEKKEEKKEKDEDKNAHSDALLKAFSELVKNKFRDACQPPSDIAHELESPPPEV